jgi:outer membrane receptor protein involved in Fe transport
VEAAPVAGYSKGKEVVADKGKEAPVAAALPCWKTILNNTTLSFGVSNVFDQEPPKSYSIIVGVPSNTIGYPGGLYDNIGRFWYTRLVKKF